MPAVSIGAGKARSFRYFVSRAMFVLLTFNDEGIFQALIRIFICIALLPVYEYNHENISRKHNILYLNDSLLTYWINNNVVACCSLVSRQTVRTIGGQDCTYESSQDNQKLILQINFLDLVIFQVTFLCGTKKSSEVVNYKVSRCCL